MRHFSIILILLGLTVASSTLMAQNKQVDLALLGESKPPYDLRSWKALYDNPKKKSPKFIQIINPFYWISAGLLTTYQQVISPQISASCVYETSCSRFSRIAIKKYGIIKGIALTADRLSRCTHNAVEETSPIYFNSKGKIRDVLLHKHLPHNH